MCYAGAVRIALALELEHLKGELPPDVESEVDEDALIANTLKMEPL